MVKEGCGSSPLLFFPGFLSLRRYIKDKPSLSLSPPPLLYTGSKKRLSEMLLLGSNSFPFNGKE